MCTVVKNRVLPLVDAAIVRFQLERFLVPLLFILREPGEVERNLGLVVLVIFVHAYSQEIQIWGLPVLFLRSVLWKILVKERHYAFLVYLFLRF